MVSHVKNVLRNTGKITVRGDKMLPVIIGVLKVAAMASAFAGVIIASGSYIKYSEKNYFNDGVCPKCGGHFKYIEGTATKGSKGYKCDVCDNCIWVDFDADKNYKYVPSKNARDN